MLEVQLINLSRPLKQQGRPGLSIKAVQTNLEFYLGQILSLFQAKKLGQYLTQIFQFIEGQYLIQMKFQIPQNRRVDAS